jgi:hypothetical protein
LDLAAQDLTRALQAVHKSGNLLALLPSVAGIALLRACQIDPWDLEEAARIAELAALCAQSPLFANARFYQDVIGQRVAAATAHLSPEAAAAAQARGRARDLNAAVAEWLAERAEAGDLEA